MNAWEFSLIQAAKTVAADTASDGLDVSPQRHDRNWHKADDLTRRTGYRCLEAQRTSRRSPRRRGYAFAPPFAFSCTNYDFSRFHA
jgi:hypothetical protein